MKTVIIGPTGSHLRTVNLTTGVSGPTGTWATAAYVDSGPAGLFETVQVAVTRDHRFKSVAVPGFTGTATVDPSSGGGGGYVAKAVHFDGTAWLINSGLVASDSDLFSMTGWSKYTDASNNTLWVVDPEDTYLSAANDDGSTFLYSSGGTLQIVPMGGNPEGTWFSFVLSANTTTLEAKLYINDVDVTQQSGAVPFSMLFNGLPFWFGNDDSATGCVSDFADIRLMPGVSLLNAGDIPEATRRLFVSATNKPVDPSVATAALGAAGAVLFSGDASGFPTNQGTGGTFTLTGSLTNATTSPSD